MKKIWVILFMICLALQSLSVSVLADELSGQRAGSIATEYESQDLFRDFEPESVPTSAVPVSPEGLDLSATSCILMEVSTGKVLYDGEYEPLQAGSCHYCPKGHTHALINDGNEDLVFYAVLPTLK